MPTFLGNSETFYDDVAAPSITKYVAKTGNDSSGDGSEGNPYLTINKAIDVIDTAGTTDGADVGTGTRALIIVASGTYEEIIDCDGQLNLTIRGTGVPGKRTCLEYGGAADIDDDIRVLGARAGVHDYGNGLILENLHFSGLSTAGNYVLHHAGANPYARVFNCEISMSKGSPASGIYGALTGYAAWPSRIDCCIFRGGEDRAIMASAGRAINFPGSTGVDDGCYITNNLIYSWSRGIYMNNNRANIYNNTVVSCSTMGIQTGTNKCNIINNIVLRCYGGDNSAGAGNGGIIIDSSAGTVHTNNYTTGNVPLKTDETPNVYDGTLSLHRDLWDTNGTDHQEALGTGEVRGDPGLKLTGTVGVTAQNDGDIYFDGPAGWNSADDGLWPFSFEIKSRESPVVDAGATTVSTAIRNSDIRNYKREYIGQDDGRHPEKQDGTAVVPTLKSIDVGAYEFVAWRKCQETKSPIISSDFTLNAGYSYQADDRYLADIDILEKGIAQEFGAEPTPPPFTAGIKGVLSLRGAGGAYKLTPEGSGRKSPDKITKDDS
jgi:hypothetical protein